MDISPWLDEFLELALGLSWLWGSKPPVPYIYYSVKIKCFIK